MKVQKLLASEKPMNIIPPVIGYRKKFYDFYHSKIYSNIITTILILNVLILANSAFFNNEVTFNVILIVIVSLYNFESNSKLYAYGFRGYFLFYKMEYIISFLCFSQLFLEISLAKQNKYKNNIFLRNFSIVKILPILRILPKLKIIEKILKILKFILPFLINMLGLFIVNIFIFSILGCFLFGKVEKGKIIDDYVNFKNLFYGIMTLFKMATGDDWSIIMMDTINPIKCYKNMKCNSSFFLKIIKKFIYKYNFSLKIKNKDYTSYMFFFTFMILNNLVILNMFALILIQQFEDYYKNSCHPVFILKDFLKHFHSSYCQYLSDKNVMKIDISNILNFLRYLPPPLGF